MKFILKINGALLMGVLFVFLSCGTQTQSSRTWQEMIASQHPNLDSVDRAFERWLGLPLAEAEKIRKANKQGAKIPLKGRMAQWDQVKKYKMWRSSALNRTLEDGTVLSDAEVAQLNQKTGDLLRAAKDINSPPPSVVTQGAGSGTALIMPDIPNSLSYGMWENIGPTGDPDIHWSATGNGAINYVTTDYRNAGTFYVTPRARGAFKTTDYGKHWKQLSEHFTSGAGHVALDPQNSQILYLGSRNIYKSIDGGVSWQPSLSGIGNKFVNKIIVSPKQANLLVAGTDVGVYSSADGGINWTLAPVPQINMKYVDAFADGSLVVASGEGDADKIYISRDFGGTWDSVALPSYVSGVGIYGGVTKCIHTAIYNPHPAALDQRPQIVVIIDGDSALNATPHRLQGMWKSVDSAKTFTSIKNPNYDYNKGPDFLSTSLVAMPDDYSSVFGNYTGYTGGLIINPKNPAQWAFPMTKFWGTLDGGQTWYQLPGYGGSHWADMHSASNDFSGDSLYFSDDGGVWASSWNDLITPDNSKVFSRNGDLAIHEASELSISKYQKGVFMTGGRI